MGSFFNSWALWEKMTFVLALAIFAVFCAGALKVVWRNRFVKKHEKLDIEKKAKIQELRKSGQFVKPKSEDIPFGVRAIQSGIQVDGIWISGKDLPARESLQLGHHAGSSSDSSSESVNRQSFMARPPGERNKSRGRDKRPSVQAQRGSIAVHQVLRNNSRTPSSGPSGYSSYKPRRSSHLRFGSYGDPEYDGDTLAQLEGQRQSFSKTHKYGSGQADEQNDDASSGHGADNERSSTDSESSVKSALEKQGLTSQPPLRIASLQSSPKLVESTEHQEPLQAQFSNDHYISISSTEPERLQLSGSSNSRISVNAVKQVAEDHSPEEPHVISVAQEPKAIERSESFAPGELHINRNSRVVNSGFEVLPAGTFGTPTEFKSSETGSSQTWQQQVEDERDRRQSQKLHKKGRTSINLGRASFGNDRP
ncbi:hypothetical protein BP5796_00302 [Coleophoma crateriformis]|uniref:Uncharacterized protein n=1 Tax=Coleophoma crateriformis TaxID=565419 RepID=A0A3D8T7L3_9HELO|nr:hypothetical protein BP5796_00302 [Coleophoma crateriformis]